MELIFSDLQDTEVSMMSQTMIFNNNDNWSSGSGVVIAVVQRWKQFRVMQ